MKFCEQFFTKFFQFLAVMVKQFVDKAGLFICQIQYLRPVSLEFKVNEKDPSFKFRYSVIDAQGFLDFDVEKRVFGKKRLSVQFVQSAEECVSFAFKSSCTSLAKFIKIYERGWI